MLEWFRQAIGTTQIRHQMNRIATLERLVREQLLVSLSSDPRYSDPRCLVRRGYRIFSQNDEDGIIDEIFHRIGTTSRQFVEFGVETGVESNTSALLLSGWNGLWIEASPSAAAAIREAFDPPLRAGQLRLLEAFVTAESIEGLLESGGAGAEFDLLSIDVDGNDYWIWKAIRRARPRVVVIEYNASLGRTARLVQPYDPRHRWDGSAAFGASLAALARLGEEKGYALVGCNLTGVNAFFVRSDCLQDRFLMPYTAEAHYAPPRYGPTGGGHPLRWCGFESVSSL